MPYKCNKHKLNTLRPRQNARHFPEDLFKCIFANENVWISLNISLAFVPEFRINTIPELVQIMAPTSWQAIIWTMMVNLVTHICVTRPQWVNVCKMSRISLYCPITYLSCEFCTKIRLFCYPFGHDDYGIPIFSIEGYYCPIVKSFSEALKCTVRKLYIIYGSLYLNPELLSRGISNLTLYSWMHKVLPNHKYIPYILSVLFVSMVKWYFPVG